MSIDLKIDKLEQKIDKLEQKIDKLEQKIDIILERTLRADKHVDFVETTYDKFKSPLFFVKDKIDNLIGCSGNDRKQNYLTEK